ncbi:hypothetical protein F9C07_2232396 [Aspergillus flavus]|uniref:Uncharacterized protein n=1 Tax=Aspergillus flavus (strain ATCC 200026 / FGSC A1120 / IAM 13836 / NRRL 3357 / JCM 12722 / SRRC 167) TaxID=332952 RepID=A0A7U2MU55_ASPFN|nr:hypothetical protein AFLA_002331 [Aspergillus flavus NRRL3357]QRD89957.1 hypothetical protein F9C07_2232396 [Aspergillus flavus]
MGILEEIYEGTLDLSVPPEQLALDHEQVDLVPWLSVGLILQQMQELTAIDNLDFPELIAALHEAGMTLGGMDETIVGKIDTVISVRFDPSDDALVDQISQWVSKSVWPPILGRFKLDRPEFIRQLVERIGASLDRDHPTIRVSFCFLNMIDFASTDSEFSEGLVPGLFLGPTIYVLEILGRRGTNKKKLWINCRFHTCRATVDDNSEERKVHKLLSRFFKEHGPAAGIDLNPIIEQLSI